MQNLLDNRKTLEIFFVPEHNQKYICHYSYRKPQQELTSHGIVERPRVPLHANVFRIGESAVKPQKTSVTSSSRCIRKNASVDDISTAAIGNMQLVFLAHSPQSHAAQGIVVCRFSPLNIPCEMDTYGLLLRAIEEDFVTGFGVALLFSNHRTGGERYGLGDGFECVCVWRIEV